MSLALKIVLAVVSVILLLSVSCFSPATVRGCPIHRRRSRTALRQKEKPGYEGLLSKISTVTAILFIVLSLVLVALE